MARGGELKLFGCAIPLRRERSGGKDIVAAVAATAEEEATTSGICIEEAAAAIHIRDGGGGKVRKEGVSANTQVPEDNDDGEEQEEEEIPTTGGTAIISDNNDNNNNDNNNNNRSDSNSNKDNRKLMKKPEKLLPCPRCKSLNTKFCYFNNGNANQPRHFCRGCQRYWTAGGALRNVPVGSGRRKSKLSFFSSSSTSHPLPHHYPSCPVVNRTDGASARSDMADSIQCSLPPQSAVLPTAVIGRHLQMGCSIQDSCKPSKSSSSYGLMAAEDGIEMVMMPLDEQSATNGGTTTTTNASNEWNGSSNGGGVGETYPPIDEYACGSSEQQPSTMVGGSGGGVYMGNSPPFGFPMQPWPFGYGLFGFSPMLNSNQSSSLTPLAGWCAPPWMGGGGGGVFPWPLMPAIPPWPPWGISPPPLVGAGFTPPCSSSSPLALGKHPREGLSQHTTSGKDRCPLTPKTLRTREPQEAAQSSVRSALGLGNNHNHNYNNRNNNSLVSAFGIFEGFPPKTKEKDGADETQEPHVNPAARTRSMGFHENS